MKCAICRNGTTREGLVTVFLERNGSTLVFKDVPAGVCDNCGEEFVSSTTNRRLLELAEDAIRRGVSLELMKYAA